jgi:hypothetical protein
VLQKKPKEPNCVAVVRKGTYTVMPLSGITVTLFPVWKWDRGQLLFNAKEIECASCNAENC